MARKAGGGGDRQRERPDWVNKGRCTNVYGAHLLRLLGRLGVRHGFSMWAERVTSEANTIPDCACRT